MPFIITLNVIQAIRRLGVKVTLQLVILNNAPFTSGMHPDIHLFIAARTCKFRGCMGRDGVNLGFASILSARGAPVIFNFDGNGRLVVNLYIKYGVGQSHSAG